MKCKLCILILGLLPDCCCCCYCRLFNYGIGIHLLQAEEETCNEVVVDASAAAAHSALDQLIPKPGADINPRDNHISFQVLKKNCYFWELCVDRNLIFFSFFSEVFFQCDEQIKLAIEKLNFGMRPTIERIKMAIEKLNFGMHPTTKRIEMAIEKLNFGMHPITS